MTPEATQPDQSEEAKAQIIASQETGGQMMDNAAKAAAAREIITGIPEGLAPAATAEDAPVPPMVEPIPGTLTPPPEAAPAPPMVEPMPGTLPTAPEAMPAPPMAEPMPGTLPATPEDAPEPPVTPDSPVV